MKAKVGRGSGFRGVLEYALGHDDARIVGGTMVGRDARQLAAEFGFVRERRQDVERPVWHTSLAAAPGEHLTDEQWQAVAEGFMKKMGFPEPTPFVVVRHASGEEQKTAVGKGPTTEHVHIIASRISIDGELWHGEWEAKKAINATQELEREHGLVQTVGLGPRAAAKKPTKPEVDMAERLSAEAGHEVKPARVQLQEKVAGAIAGGATVREFVDRLHAEGVNVRPNLASTGKMNGFAFELDGVAMKGSDLGKAFTFAGLQKAGLDYQQGRDTAFLASLTTKPLNEPRAPAPAPITTKENEHGRTGLHRRGDRGLGLDAGGDKPDVDGNGRGRRAPDEPRHHAVEAARRPPPHLEGGLHHVSESHVVLKWGRDAGALRPDVSGRVDFGRGTGRRALFGARSRAPSAATLKLPRTGYKGFQPAGPSLWSRLGKKKKGELTPAQKKQLEILADRLAHLLVKLVCRLFGVDYVTPHEQQQLEQQQRRARVMDLPPQKPPLAEPKPAARPAPRAVDPERARRAELAKASIGKAPPAPAKPAASQPVPVLASGQPAKPKAEDPRDRKNDPREVLEEKRRADAKRRMQLAVSKGQLSAALVDAVGTGEIENVERLLKAGADPTANNGKAFNEAAKAGRGDVVTQMLNSMITGGQIADHPDLKSLASQLGPQGKAMLMEKAEAWKASGDPRGAGLVDTPTAPTSGPKTPGMSGGPKLEMKTGGGGGGGGGK